MVVGHAHLIAIDRVGNGHGRMGHLVVFEAAEVGRHGGFKTGKV